MLPPWATSPEMILTYILFVIGIFFTLYAGEIRGFMRVPPSKARNWWKSGLLDAYQTELDTLRRIRNNAYEVLIYLITELGQGARISALYLAIGMLIQVLLELQAAPKDDRHFFILVFLCMVPTFIAGGLAKVYFMVRRLKTYDERVDFLEAKIAKLQSSKLPRR